MKEIIYPSLAVANFLISKSFDTGIELIPLKLIKLVYIAHGWNLAINDFPLINEVVEAWKHGVIIPEVYHNFKQFSDKQITKMYVCPYSFVVPNIYMDSMEAILIAKVWDEYSKYSRVQLSSITHKKGTPWNIARAKNKTIIPNDLIKSYYKVLLLMP